VKNVLICHTRGRLGFDLDVVRAEQFGDIVVRVDDNILATLYEPAYEPRVDVIGMGMGDQNSRDITYPVQVDLTALKCVKSRIEECAVGISRDQQARVGESLNGWHDVELTQP